MLLDLPTEMLCAIMADALGRHELVAWVALRLTCRALHGWVTAERRDRGWVPWWLDSQQAARMLDVCAAARVPLPSLLTLPAYVRAPDAHAPVYTRGACLLAHAVAAGHERVYRALLAADVAGASLPLVQDAALACDRPWAFASGRAWDMGVLRLAMDAGAVRILAACLRGHPPFSRPCARTWMLGEAKSRAARGASGPARVVAWLASGGSDADADAMIPMDVDAAADRRDTKRARPASAAIDLVADERARARVPPTRGFVLATGTAGHARAQRAAVYVDMATLLPAVLLRLLDAPHLVVRWHDGGLCDTRGRVICLRYNGVGVSYTEPDRGLAVNGAPMPPRLTASFFHPRVLPGHGLCLADSRCWLDVRGASASLASVATAPRSLRVLAAEALARHWAVVARDMGVSLGGGRMLVRRASAVEPLAPMTALEAVALVLEEAGGAAAAAGRRVVLV